MLCDEFRLHGLLCETFARAEDFVKRAPYAEAGCLITDLAMPGMRSGVFYVFEKERSLAELVPIVLDGINESRSRAGARKAQDATRGSLDEQHQTRAFAAISL